MVGSEPVPHGRRCNASSQFGFSGSPLIELNGTSAGATANGFSITNATTTLRGFIINRFGGDGIRIDCPEAEVDEGVYIYGCWIGTNAYGNYPAGNGGHGINIIASRSGAYNEIGEVDANNRNVISGNDGDGVHVAPDVQGAIFLMNNYIGVGQDGYSNVGNGGDGVLAAPYSYTGSMPIGTRRAGTTAIPTTGCSSATSRTAPAT